LARAPLPVLGAQTVGHPARERFLSLRPQRQVRSGPDALKAAQAIVVRSGGLSDTVHALLQRHSTACALLAACPLPNPSVLQELLENVVHPVRCLLAAVAPEA
jgi:hypothetical protein